MKRFALLSALAGLALAGCGEPPVPEPMGFSQINSQVLKVGCTLRVCHSPTGKSMADGLDLLTDPYGSLVGVPATNARAKSEGKLRVDPSGNLDNSFLWTKLNLTVNTDPDTDYGVLMPKDNPKLPQPQLDGIKAWILAGAPNN